MFNVFINADRDWKDIKDVFVYSNGLGRISSRRYYFNVESVIDELGNHFNVSTVSFLIGRHSIVMTDDRRWGQPYSRVSVINNDLKVVGKFLITTQSFDTIRRNIDERNYSCDKVSRFIESIIGNHDRMASFDNLVLHKRVELKEINGEIVWERNPDLWTGGVSRESSDSTEGDRVSNNSVNVIYPDTSDHISEVFARELMSRSSSHPTLSRVFSLSGTGVDWGISTASPVCDEVDQPLRDWMFGGMDTLPDQNRTFLPTDVRGVNDIERVPLATITQSPFNNISIVDDSSI